MVDQSDRPRAIKQGLADQINKKIGTPDIDLVMQYLGAMRADMVEALVECPLDKVAAVQGGIKTLDQIAKDFRRPRINMTQE